MKAVFTCDIVGFRDIKEFQPQPARNFIPKWFKDMPIDVPYFSTDKLIPNTRTVRLCPSFTDIFTEGFVLPAPCDIWMKVDKDDVEKWSWKLPNDKFSMEMHTRIQYSAQVPHTPVKQIFKLNYPWRLIVPKGYSVRQVPLIYDYNPDWHVAYGTYHADVVNEINLQILFTSDKEEILIKAGEPLCYYIPYKREELEMVIDNDYEKYKPKIEESMFRALAKFKNAYRIFNK